MSVFFSQLFIAAEVMSIKKYFFLHSSSITLHSIPSIGPAGGLTAERLLV